MSSMDNVSKDGICKPGKQGGDKLVIIDTDAGMDDAWALFMALEAHRNSTTPNFKIVGITTLSGNTTVDNVTNNVTRVLDLVGESSLPIYRGMSEPMINEFRYFVDPPYHGEDGFGDADLPEIPTRIEPEHSVNAIIRLVETYPGQITIICLGPLTNLAMAVKLKPEIKTILKEIFILGGTIEGFGNVDGASSTSEFNFLADPEGAKVVLESYTPCPITILPWETLLKYGFSSYDWRVNVLGKVNTPEVALLNKIEANHLAIPSDVWMVADPFLVACILNPNVIKRVESEFYCSVELNGTHTRGMMVVDRKEVLQKPPNATLILEVNLSIYEGMLLKAVGG